MFFGIIQYERASKSKISACDELINNHDHPKTNAAWRRWPSPHFDKETSYFKSMPRRKPSGVLHPPWRRRRGQLLLKTNITDSQSLFWLHAGNILITARPFPLSIIVCTVIEHRLFAPFVHSMTTRYWQNFLKVYSPSGFRWMFFYAPDTLLICACYF